MSIFEEFSVIEKDGARSMVLASAVGGAGEMAGWHWHDSYELLCVRRGACVQALGGGSWTLRVGDVFLIAPRQAHATRATDPDGCRIDVVKFAPDLPDEALSGGLYPVEPGGREEVARLFARLSQESEESDAAHGQVEKGMILTLLGLLRRHCPDAPPPRRDLARFEAVRRAAQYIEGNLLRPVTLREAAAHCGYSPEHLSRTFRRATGGTFKAYADEIKLDAAVTLMCRENLTVGDTAAALGFGSAAAFIRAFHRRYGFPPGKYRAMCRQARGDGP